MERAYQFLKEIINENDTVVVAVSAGPDSMALFDTLISLKHEKNINIICAHVNHNTGRFGQDEEQSGASPNRVPWHKQLHLLPCNGEESG